MTELMKMLDRMGLQAEEIVGDQWVKLRGEQFAVYIVEADWGSNYYTWCDAPGARSVERYTDAATAIEAGLRRAANAAPTGDHGNTPGGR